MKIRGQIVRGYLGFQALAAGLVFASLLLAPGLFGADLAAKRQALQQRRNLPIQSPPFRNKDAQNLAAGNSLLKQRLDARLAEAWQQSQTNASQSLAALRRAGVRLTNDQVVVIVQCEPTAEPKTVAAAIAANGGAVIRAGHGHVKAAVPVEALGNIATNIAGVTAVQRPIEPQRENAVLSEGRGSTLASAWQALGYRGQGVKVAVIDQDFRKFSDRVVAGELPASLITMNFSTEAMDVGGDGHGCACAEIIYDLAPACQLYLLKVLDPSDEQEALDYCKAQGIQIVSYSAGYRNLNFYDGTAPSSVSPHPAAIANDAAANGILWVNSAGNDQLDHALIGWQDSNGDRYLDWNSYGDGVNELWNDGYQLDAGAVIDVYLTWNRWPVTSQDFDLILFRATETNWVYVTSSADTQSGTQTPTEHVQYVVPTAGTYGVGIYKYRASASPTFVLRSSGYGPYFFSYDNDQHPVGGSLTCPADAAGSLSVGAMDCTNYPQGDLEWFSSIGPNNGAYTGNPVVNKPDVCAPDGVSTATYGNLSFFGTSAAAPHIAALAALVKSAFPAYTNTQLRAYLQGCAVDLGLAGTDNLFGYGAVVLPPSPFGIPPSFTLQPQSQLCAVGRPAQFAVSASGTEPLAYRWLFNGTPIAGATNTNYLIAATTTNQAGLYSVSVSNVAGLTNSPAARLGLDLIKTAGVVTIYSPTGTQYRIDVSATMASNSWANLTNFTLPYSPYHVVDPAAKQSPHRFYRVTGP